MMRVIQCLAFLCPLALPSLLQETPRPKEFWQEIARQPDSIPKDESAFELLVELSQHLGSRDPELRDGLAYGIAAQWLASEAVLSNDEALALTHIWSENLGQGLEQGGDGVLLRSFSALCLAAVAARDLQVPFLTVKGFQDLLEAALHYQERENDLRGWHPEWGWVHAAAHTADLLKFLARSRHLTPDEQAAILDGIAYRLVNTDGTVFVHGEDQRLAAVALSLLFREDLDAAGFESFVKTLSAPMPRSITGFDPVAFAGKQNATNLLRVLFVQLSQLRKVSAAQEKARDLILEGLSGR